MRNSFVTTGKVISAYGKIRPLFPDHTMDSNASGQGMRKGHHIAQAGSGTLQRKYCNHIAILNKRIHAETLGPESERYTFIEHCPEEFDQGWTGDLQFTTFLAEQSRLILNIT